MGKSAITLHVSFMLEESNFFNFSGTLKTCSNQRFVISTGALL